MRFDSIIKNEIIMQSMLLNPIYYIKTGFSYEERNQAINCLKGSILCPAGYTENNNNQSTYDDNGTSIKLFIIFKS